jgi:exo-beta-1,3-glucanase (GH17 family)
LLLTCCVSPTISPSIKPTVNDIPNTHSNDIKKLYGIDFSPYMNEQNPDKGSYVKETQIWDRMRIIVPYAEWVRTYGTTRGLEPAAGIGKAYGLKTAVGAWLSHDIEANEKEINKLIEIANAGQADLLIVGSETLLRNNLTEDQLVQYIRRVKNETSGVDVTTADTFHELLSHKKVMEECDVIMPNYYPYWEGKDVNISIKIIDEWHKQMVQNANGKPVIISETGWPTAGNTIDKAVPSSENSKKYFLEFLDWAYKNNVSYFYFEATDEPWKATSNEGEQGAHWGIWDNEGIMKPGMDEAFKNNK